MSHHTSRSIISNLKVLVVLGAFLFAMFLIGGGAREHVAVAEAQFSDESPAGLAVIPASGASEAAYTGSYTGTYTSSYFPMCMYPIEGGWDAYGRILYAGYYNRYINFNGYFNCMNNPTGNTFFVPAGSGPETGSFISAAPGLGVQIR